VSRGESWASLQAHSSPSPSSASASVSAAGPSSASASASAYCFFGAELCFFCCTSASTVGAKCCWAISTGGQTTRALKINIFAILHTQ